MLPAGIVLWDQIAEWHRRMLSLGFAGLGSFVLPLVLSAVAAFYLPFWLVVPLLVALPRLCRWLVCGDRDLQAEFVKLRREISTSCWRVRTVETLHDGFRVVCSHFPDMRDGLVGCGTAPAEALADALAQIARHRPDMPPTEADYVMASLACISAEDNFNRRRNWRAARPVLVLLALDLAAMAWSIAGHPGA